jgi:hypothetical protein
MGAYDSRAYSWWEKCLPLGVVLAVRRNRYERLAAEMIASQRAKGGGIQVEPTDAVAPSTVIESPAGRDMVEVGRRGGQATSEKMGLEHYRRIGSLGGKRRAENAAKKSST